MPVSFQSQSLRIFKLRSMPWQNRQQISFRPLTAEPDVVIPAYHRVLVVGENSPTYVE